MTTLSPINIKWKTRPTTRMVIIHDSHTGPEVENVRDYLQFRGRQMGLLEIGYHFIIERSGEIVETRDRHVFGSHAPGHNHHALGVCLIGGKDDMGFSQDNFTFDQKKALITRLLPEIIQEWPGIAVKGHDEVSRMKHACPAWIGSDIREDFSTYSAIGVIP